MSALVRTASVYSSNNSQVLNTMSNGHGTDHGSLVTARNIPNTASPLQIFVRAKKKINDIFADIELYSEESLNFLGALPEDEEIIAKDSVNGIRGYSAKVHAIRDVLSRDHMKCVFFGRTSNGKSSVINAMLREKILPSGIGHTTNCFLQVEGSENGESYLITEDSSEKQNVKSVAQLAHALCTEKIGDSALMRVVWPKDKCPLLRDDVVFVDSPGIDVSPNLDEWIDKHCLDADVFVLVANAESTLMLTEKNFFHKVSSRLSKPNIFILNNRWDASANEPEYLDEVRKQHMQRSVDFLLNELRVISSEQEAKNRVFFVSAKEVLQARVNEQKGLPLNTGITTSNFSERLFEFQDFEKRFEECISRSAVRTKFDQHTTRGKSIVSDVRSVMEKVHESAVARCEQKSRERVHLAESIEETERQMLLITKEAKHRICNMVEEVEMKVSKAISEEIRRLSILVEEFNEPFDSNPLVLNEFKKKLHKHVDYGLVTNLRSRLTSAVAMNMEAAKKEMAARVINILPESKRESVQLPFDSRPFEVQYPFRCDNLCADFKEDIEFKFSFGVLTVVNRFVGGRNGVLSKLRRHPTEEVPRPLALTPETPVVETASLLAGEDWSVVSKFAMATISSQGAMGGLLVGGFLMKTVGWRLIVATGVFYGAMYIYERLMWTNKAKERTFKRQYVEHVTRQLRLVVDLVSSNCSHQVQQELSSTFARLGSFVDNASVDMQNQLQEVERSIQLYDAVGTEAKKLRNKANYIINELDLFEEAFLKST